MEIGMSEMKKTFRENRISEMNFHRRRQAVFACIHKGAGENEFRREPMFLKVLEGILGISFSRRIWIFKRGEGGGRGGGDCFPII